MTKTIVLFMCLAVEYGHFEEYIDAAAACGVVAIAGLAVLE
jgi:hypothetical protein